jgi:hypothetical protein
MGNASRRNDASGHTGLLSQFRQCWQSVVQGCGAIVPGHRCIYPQYADTSLLPGCNRGDGTRAVWNLSIGVVGFNQGQVGEAIKGEVMLLAGGSLGLARKNSCRSNGADTHAIAKEENHILSLGHATA